MMNALLPDEAATRDFCRNFLLPHPNCPRLLQCVARKKYAKDDPDADWQGPDCAILERTVLYFDRGQASEDAFIRELRKMEILANAGGIYFTNPRDVKPAQSIPLAWTVVYITAYPLDEDEAADAFVSKLLSTRQDQRRAHAKGNHQQGMAHILSKVQTLLHQHPSKSIRWLKLDVDTKDPKRLTQLQDALQGATIVMAVETRGGYHVVLEKGPYCQGVYALEKCVNKGVAHKDQWLTIENNSGPMLAIPGTNQGGFTVKPATDVWRKGVALQTQRPSELFV
eukprot:scaffold846_cov168-Amphora_coffeaeformis.AAC.17